MIPSQKLTSSSYIMTELLKSGVVSTGLSSLSWGLRMGVDVREDGLGGFFFLFLREFFSSTRSILVSLRILRVLCRCGYAGGGVLLGRSTGTVAGCGAERVVVGMVRVLPKRRRMASKN